MGKLMEFGESRLTFMEIIGRFLGNKYKFPLSVDVEASIASINFRFHEYFPWGLP